MTVPSLVVDICLLLLMVAGILTLVTAFRIGIAQLSRPDGKQSKVKIPFFKDLLSLRGRHGSFLRLLGF